MKLDDWDDEDEDDDSDGVDSEEPDGNFEFGDEDLDDFGLWIYSTKIIHPF